MSKPMPPMWRCPECNAPYERTADEKASICPNGHGKLMPPSFSLSEKEKRELKKANEKSDREEKRA